MQHVHSEQSLNRITFSATLHCLTGCAIGEVLGMIIGTALGWGDWQTIALAVVLAFGPGLTLYGCLLRAGGSLPPEELGRMVGIDLADPGFWSSGLDLVERQLEAAERAAEEAGRLG